MADVAGTVNVPGKLSDILGQSIPLGADPIILFTLSEPAVTQDETLITAFERRVQVAADGTFTAKLVPTTTMRPYVFYKIGIGIRDATAEYRVIDFPQFRLHVPSGGGKFADLVTAPPPPGVASFGFGPPTRTYAFYVDISGDKPIFWVNGVPA
jgi:hypothetical protein